VFNLSSSEAIKEAGPAVAVFIACFALNLPLGIVQRVQSGYQQGYLSNVWQAVGSVLSLGGLLLVVSYRGGLPWLVLAVVGASVFATLVNWITEFGIARRWLMPAYRQVELQAVAKLAKIGFLFFILQATVAIAFASDNLVASQVLGPAAAARYSVAQRAFMLAPLIVGFIVAPLWPAYGEALARGDSAWVRKTFMRSIGVALSICVPLSACLVIFAGPIFTAWVGVSLTPPTGVTLGLGVWAILYTLGSAVAMLLNAANVVGFQVITAISLACTSIVFKILLAEHFGIAGIPWALVTTYTVAVAIPTSIYLVRRFRTDW
jgi:O-antigen/teichoic acid export membrane protein